MLVRDEREDHSKMGWMGLKGSAAEMVLIASVAHCQVVLGESLLITR